MESSVASRRTATIETTTSLSSREADFTPCAVRPMARTSCSWKRMALPWRLARMMSCVPSVMAASIISSPSSRSMALMPPRRGLPYAESSVFLMAPWRVALDVPGVADGDHHVLVLDQVLDRDLAFLGDDLRAALVAVLRLQLAHLALDDLEDLLRVREDAPQALDLLDDGEVLRLDLVALERHQAAEAHVEDRVGLDLRQRELRHEARARRFRVGRGADELDHRIEVIDGDLEALEDVGALLGLGQLELGAPAHDRAAVLDVLLEHGLQRQRLRPAVDEREHDGAERRLQLRVHVELVQHDPRLGILLELDHDAHAVAIGLVAQVRDAGQLLVLYQLSDLSEQVRLLGLARA